MEGRCASSPEPVQARIIVEGRTWPIIDAQRFTQFSEIDIPPVESEPLDVAARFAAEDDSYRWNNEAYFSGWRTPQWKLPKGRYLVSVKVRSPPRLTRQINLNVYGATSYNVLA